jgi:succinate dehydrogenase / fumarate reductase, iron-sulfur subunit
MLISIYRFNHKDNDYTMKTYDVNPEDCNGVMLLDALIFIKENLDTTLTFRRSCGEGVCGSDAMNINGKNGLACITPLSFFKDKIVVRPLPGMPVIKDLVVDLTNFYNQYKKIKPFLQTENSVSYAAEMLQSKEDRLKLDGLYECILCACCTSSCPSYWWNPDKFLGPAACLQSLRFVNDSRDAKKRERLMELDDKFNIFRCRTIMNCTYVCPKGLNPAKAIGDLRLEMIKMKI